MRILTAEVPSGSTVRIPRNLVPGFCQLSHKLTTRVRLDSGWMVAETPQGESTTRRLQSNHSTRIGDLIARDVTGPRGVKLISLALRVNSNPADSSLRYSIDRKALSCVRHCERSAAVLCQAGPAAPASPLSRQCATGPGTGPLLDSLARHEGPLRVRSRDSIRNKKVCFACMN